MSDKAKLNTLNESIKDAWTLRFSQRNDECLIRLALIKQALNLPFGEITPELVRRSCEQPEAAFIAHAALLQASLNRAARTQAASQQTQPLLNAVRNVLTLNDDPSARFRLEFESATEAFVSGDYQNAMERYVRASDLAQTSDLKLASQVNLLLCMDNLGLGGTQTRKEIDSLATQTKMDAIRSHVQALDLRHAFRRGDLENVFIPDSQLISGGSKQIEYFRAWVAELPFHTHYAPGGTFMEQFLTQNLSSAMRGFRSRTLQGRAHPEDKWASLSDQVDRFYLWTWRWLINPETATIEKTVSQAAEFKLPSQAERLTMEDRQLLRNSLLWLSVFDPASDTLVEKSISGLQVTEKAQIPLLHFESVLAHWLIARRNHDLSLATDYLAELKSLPLWNSKSILFSTLAQTLTEEATDQSKEKLPPQLQLLASHLRDTFPATKTISAARGKKNDVHRVSVDVFRMHLSTNADKTGIVSEPMALAYELLSRTPAVTFEEFAAHCFGIRKFDSVIHMSKIFNLLARMRALSGNLLTIRTKAGFIRTEGQWERITIYHGKISVRAISKFPAWNALLDQDSSQAKVIARQTANRDSSRVITLPAEAISRAQLETLLNRPRSTVNRYLAHWEKLKLVHRVNSGKSTLYQLDPKLAQRPEFKEALA